MCCPAVTRADLFSGQKPVGFLRRDWHLGRVVKAVDSKSTGLCPRQFESGRCRFFYFFLEQLAPASSRARSGTSTGAWSSGMILALGARGRGFNSRSSPAVFLEMFADVRKLSCRDVMRFGSFRALTGSMAEWLRR
jgi:hypothetical protein